MEKPQPKPRLICLVGPTASGKSALAVEIARRVKGEIISGDSRQVYRGLDIGTGKITKREMRRIPHHLLDVASPKGMFTAQDFVVAGRSAINSIYRAGKVPIVCGGTGFYIDALLGRLQLPEVPPNAALRKRLELVSTETLFARLERKDPVRAMSIDTHNKPRLIRALEIAKALGRSPAPLQSELYDVLWMGLKPNMATLKDRINTRLDERLRQGMAAEARRLHAHGLSWKRMYDLGLEYRYLAKYLMGDLTKKGLVEELGRAIYQYARRQMSYWRRNRDIRWYEPTETDRIFEDVQAFLYS